METGKRLVESALGEEHSNSAAFQQLKKFTTWFDLVHWGHSDDFWHCGVRQYSDTAGVTLLFQQAQTDLSGPRDVYGNFDAALHSQRPAVAFAEVLVCAAG